VACLKRHAAPGVWRWEPERSNWVFSLRRAVFVDETLTIYRNSF
jgi:hypothetical protein